MRIRSLLVVALLAALGLPAFAPSSQAQSSQGGPPQGTPTRIRGTIAKLDGNTLSVKTREGPTVAIALAPNYVVRALARKKLSDIHAGDFVGTTSVPGKDGKAHAVEIHFFPANSPIPDSQTPWDLQPGSLMTNAHVTGVAKAPQGPVLSVNYKSGTTDVIVGPKTAIVGPADGAPADLKRGKVVFVIALKKDDGSLAATNVTVEKNGVKPPM
jgi:hypothetical protein